MVELSDLRYIRKVRYARIELSSCDKWYQSNFRPGGVKLVRVKKLSCPLEGQVAKLEFMLTDQMETIEQHNESIDSIKSGDYKLFGRMQGLLNSAVGDLNNRFENLVEDLSAQILAMQKEIKEVKADWSLCKMMMT